jgi:hypothetical protein
VWSTGGCRSWYLDDDGINRALWPGFSFEYWARTRRARRSAYAVTPASAGRAAPHPAGAAPHPAGAAPHPAGAAPRPAAERESAR